MPDTPQTEDLESLIETVISRASDRLRQQLEDVRQRAHDRAQDQTEELTAA